jgi:hypothetical protein
VLCTLSSDVSDQLPDIVSLNMRTAYGIYRSLQVYLETYADDRELDEHFKSGVQLGAGLSSLMLSLLPSKVMKVSNEYSDP